MADRGSSRRGSGSRFAVVSLVANSGDAPPPLEESAEWFAHVSRGRWRPEFCHLPPVTLPRAWNWYLGGAGGKGAAPNNSQTLAGDAMAACLASPATSPAGCEGTNPRFQFQDGFECSGWLFVVPAAFAPHTWNLAVTQIPGMPAKGAGRWRYAVIPVRSPLGTVAHELGHLAFGWPDLVWNSTFEDECLMARGARLAQGARPSPPSAALLAAAGWREIVPLTRQLRVAELTDASVGRLEYGPWEYFVEMRADQGRARLLGYRIWRDARALLPRPIAKVILTPNDECRSVLGLLAPFLRRAFGNPTDPTDRSDSF